MSETLDTIWRLRNERDRLKLLLDAYNDVRAHIAPKLNPGAITLATLDESRQELGIAINKLRDEMRTIRAKCSHAWEKIGEARPPFWQCVRCADTTEIEP